MQFTSYRIHTLTLHIQADLDHEHHLLRADFTSSDVLKTIADDLLQPSIESFTGMCFNIPSPTDTGTICENTTSTRLASLLAVLEP